MIAIIKTAKTLNEYAIWNSDSHIFTEVFTKEELISILHFTQHALDRLDRTGTSMLNGFYGWHSSGFVIHTSVNNTLTSCWLSRQDLSKYIAGMQSGNDDLIKATLTPLKILS